MHEWEGFVFRCLISCGYNEVEERGNGSMNRMNEQLNEKREGTERSGTAIM